MYSKCVKRSYILFKNEDNHNIEEVLVVADVVQRLFYLHVIKLDKYK